MEVQSFTFVPAPCKSSFLAPRTRLSASQSSPLLVPNPSRRCLNLYLWISSSSEAKSFPRMSQQEDASPFIRYDMPKPSAMLRRHMLSLIGSMAAATVTFSVTAAPMPTMAEPDLPRFRKTQSGVKIQGAKGFSARISSLLEFQLPFIVVEGSGPEATTGDVVEFDYVCRRSNGYFVYSTVDQFNDQSQPVVLPLGVGRVLSDDHSSFTAQEKLENTSQQYFLGSAVFSWLVQEHLVDAQVSYCSSHVLQSDSMEEFPEENLRFAQIIPGLEEVIVGMKPGGKRRALVPPDVGYVNTSLEPQPHEFGPLRSLMAHAKEPLVFEVQLLKIR